MNVLANKLFFLPSNKMVSFKIKSSFPHYVINIEFLQGLIFKCLYAHLSFNKNRQFKLFEFTKQKLYFSICFNTFIKVNIINRKTNFSNDFVNKYN